MQDAVRVYGVPSLQANRSLRQAVEPSTFLTAPMKATAWQGLSGTRPGLALALFGSHLLPCPGRQHEGKPDHESDIAPGTEDRARWQRIGRLSRRRSLPSRSKPFSG